VKIVAAHPGPNFSVHDVHVGWMEAFKQLGHQVAEYNLNERLRFYDAAMIELPDSKWRKALMPEQAYELATNGLYSTLYRLRPDILFVTSAFFYPVEMFDIARSYGTRVVVLHTESPYEDERQLNVAAHTTINLLNDSVHLEQFKRQNSRSFYMPHSYRPALHRPGPVKKDVAADFAFVGTAYPSRIDFLEAVDYGDADVLLAGNWQWLHTESHLFKYVAHARDECLDNEQAVDIYRSAKIGLNLYRKEADSADNVNGLACGPREVEMAACGMFFLRESRWESDNLFPMLPTVETPQDLTDKLRWWLAHEDLRNETALKARNASQDRTFLNRATELMELLEKGD
jgi:spore maturation protein CgeB